MQHKLQFVIVDDHSLFRNGLKLLLQNYYPEAEIIEASNGLEYIRLIEKYSPGLVFMDINMPVMNGIELTKKIREHSVYKNIPILMATTESDLTQKEIAKKAGKGKEESSP